MAGSPVVDLNSMVLRYGGKFRLSLFQAPRQKQNAWGLGRDKAVSILASPLRRLYYLRPYIIREPGKRYPVYIFHYLIS